MSLSPYTTARLVILFATFLVPGIASAAAPQAVRDYAVSALKPMINPANCVPADLPRWPKGVVRRCTHTSVDTKPQDGPRRRISYLVWLADPLPERVAEWAWSACLRAKRDVACAKEVIDHIRSVSSAGHFPVAGFYYEDICDQSLLDGHRCDSGRADGLFESWAFRDGVTSRFEELERRNGEIWPATTADLTAESEATVTATLVGMASGKTRPVSLTPGMLSALAPKWKIALVPQNGYTQVDAQRWSEIVRALYMPALTGSIEGSENPIVTAWVCRTATQITPKACFAGISTSLGPPQ